MRQFLIRHSVDLRDGFRLNHVSEQIKEAEKSYQIAQESYDPTEEMKVILKETEDLELELGLITTRLESSPEKPVNMRVLQLKIDIRTFRERIIEELDSLESNRRNVTNIQAELDSFDKDLASVQSADKKFVQVRHRTLD